MTERRRAGAVFVDGGRVVDIGDADELSARYPAVERQRFERITPGVHDAHVHPVGWGRALDELDLSGITDPRVAAERVARRVESLAPECWVHGMGYIFDRYPDSTLLDEVAPANPVLLESRDLHSAWANRSALACAGIGPRSADPPGGVILRANGARPSGYLLEKAVGLVKSALPPPSRDDLLRGLADFAARGYVAAHAMDYEAPEALAWVEAIARCDELPLRVWWAVARENWRNVEPGWRGADLDIAAVKFFTDGALGSRTALMHAPYPDGSMGVLVDPPEMIRAEGDAAIAAGFTLAIHAIGTRALANALDVVAELPRPSRSMIRIEHAQHVRTDELVRLCDAPVALSMQPIHLPTDAALVHRYQPCHEEQAFRFRDLQRTGRPLAFGSDAPVAPPNLAAGLQAATDHALDPEQALDERAAVHAFTFGAALAAGWDDYGVLAPGARADLALWQDGQLVARFWRGRLEPVRQSTR
jgi:predicted amidohydrolase YtcJ